MNMLINRINVMMLCEWKQEDKNRTDIDPTSTSSSPAGLIKPLNFFHCLSRSNIIAFVSQIGSLSSARSSPLCPCLKWVSWGFRLFTFTASHNFINPFNNKTESKTFLLAKMKNSLSFSSFCSPEVLLIAVVVRLDEAKNKGNWNILMTSLRFITILLQVKRTKSKTPFALERQKSSAERSKTHHNDWGF